MKGESIVQPLDKSIMELARGGILEMVDYEMTKVIENIQDPNCKAVAERSITVTLKLTPDDSRSMAVVSATASSKLVPTNPVVSSLLIQRYKGENMVTEVGANMPGQMDLEGKEQETPVIRLLKKA